MKLIYRLVVIFIFIGVLVSIIALARGYRPDFKNKAITSTGILAISSSPKAAKVYINGELKGATDSNFTLSYGQYSVEIKKDGYTNWKKQVALKGELVLSLDAILFPLNPSLSPLTNLGIVKAIPIKHTSKIMIFAQNEEAAKDGIYLFDSNQNPLSLLPQLQLIILKKDIPSSIDGLSLKETKVWISPDLNEGIFEFSSGTYLLSLTEKNTSLFEVTQSKEALLEAWRQERDEIQAKILEAYPKELAPIASDSFDIIDFSPDETKIFYRARQNIVLPLIIRPPLIATNQTLETRSLTLGNYYVYDKKEDKNFPLHFEPDLSKKLKDFFDLNYSTYYEASLFSPIIWYANSKQLVIDEQTKLSVFDYDGGNKQVLYSALYDSSFFKITPDGKIVILANLNPEANKLPDLYLVGIR